MAMLGSGLRNAPTTSLSNPRSRRAVKGFTLIEALATLALGCVVYTFALPFYSRMATNHEVWSATQTIVSGLNVARDEAIRRNERVTFALDATHLNWTIRLQRDDSLIRSDSPKRPPNVSVTTTPASAESVIFDPLGISVPNATDVPNIQQFVVASTLAHDARVLYIKIGALRTRVCDPSSQRAAPDPKVCGTE